MKYMKKLTLILICLGAIALLLSSCAKSNESGKLIWHGDLNSDLVYLTFDDGPDPKFTPKVLDILKKNNVKATFFVLGEKAEQHPNIIKRIRREGHELGSHTFTHADGYNVNDRRVYDEIKGTDDAVRKITGRSPKYFRPPFGFFNYRYIAASEELGQKTVLWTFDVGDWNKIRAADIEKEILAKTKGGSIILLHDGGGNRDEVVKALPRVITRLKAKGFRFSTNIE